MVRALRVAGAVVVRLGVYAMLVSCAAAVVRAQQPTRSNGWVVIPVQEYRMLRLRAFPPDPLPDPPPLDDTLTRVEYDLRVNGDSASGETRLTVDILRQGWVAIEIPMGLVVRRARVDGRALPIIHEPAPHVMLAKPGRVVISLDTVVPIKASGATESVTLPSTTAAVSRAAVVVPRQGIDVTVSGGVLAERAQDVNARWVAFGKGSEELTISWKRRAEERGALPLRWRGTVTQIVGLGEDASTVSATIGVEVTQGLATSVAVGIPDGITINQVSGPLVADWDLKPGAPLRVNFLEPLSGQTLLTLSGDARMPRDGSLAVPLLRLPAAERETGGVAVEVLGAGEIKDRQPRGLDPADPSELGGSLAGRNSPSMVAFKFRPQSGSDSRSLALSIERYTPQAVLIANVEEARYEALLEEQGKTFVRARYAVRNNQRAFLGVTLPPGATLWSAAVANRPLRPGVAGSGSLLLPLEKGRSGEETPAFVVELTYMQRSSAWAEKGRATLALPTLDLPIARTGIVLHHPPRFRLTPVPGAFRVDTDTGPFTDALRNESFVVAVEGPLAAPAPPAAMPSPAPPGMPMPPPATKDEAGAKLSSEDIVERFRRDFAGRTVTGPLPVRVPFPKFGPSVFLMSELTAELYALALEFSYKRESRW